jgi:predicted glycoside hydrolase/deacetylase ChbG (UPF0249 family)
MEAFAAGAVTSTSIMVGMPGFDDAVARAQRATAGPYSLGVGLHFTLTAGRPLTPARSLVDSETGEFWSVRELIRRALTRRVDPADVAAECKAQIARARGAGLTLTHLDAHHHVHLLPGVAPAVRQVLVSEAIPAVRSPVEPLFGVPLWYRRLVGRAVISLLARRVRPSSLHVHVATQFAGMSMLGAPALETALVRFLDNLPAGVTELMVHPGYVSHPLPGNDRYTTQREMELRALTSSPVLERLHSGRIRLLHFGDLTAPAER